MDGMWNEKLIYFPGTCLEGAERNLGTLWQNILFAGRRTYRGSPKKLKFNLEQAAKAQRASRSIVLLFL